MDSKQFEKIEAVEAIALLEKGEIVYMEGGTRFRLDGNSELEGQSVEQYSFVPVELSLGWILKQNWYKTKPFDVRQAMRENPGEWVGTFTDEKFEVYKVGMDEMNFRAVKAKVDYIGKCELDVLLVRRASPSELDLCKPIIKVTK